MAVIGGGVIGLSIAWLARRRGLAVSVFDRGALGEGASRMAAGMLAPVSEVDAGEPELLAAGMAAARRWHGFADEVEEASGAPSGYRQAGTLFVAADADAAAALEREAALRDRLGLGVERFRGSAARRLEPALAPGVRSALEFADDHAVDPRMLVAALALACERAGVTLRPDHEVVTHDAHGVQLRRGERVAAGRVVLAAGAWSGEPVRPVKGQILRLRDPEGPGLLDRVIRFAPHTGGSGGYVVPRGDGRYVLGATMEERGFDTTVTARGVRELLQEARYVVPGIDELVLEEAGAGLRPGSPDNGPLVGEAADGVIWATGHYRNGVLLAPLTADAISALLCGERGPAELAPFAPERLSERITR